jgi:phosphoribosylglycinamide formyltransferase 2
MSRAPAMPASVTLGTPLSPTATRVLFLGSGELGKEVAIELQRLGVEVIAADRYADAPAMQVAHRSHVLNMLDPAALKALIEAEKPHLVVPEIEAIHTPTLLELEAAGQRVIPTARAARLTMDREGIRRLAAETLGLPTSPYRFVDTEAEYRDAVTALGMPCVVKPLMSSSGKGQSVVRSEADIGKAWAYAQTGGRAGQGRCIVEGFIDFDYEITLLTVRHEGGFGFCEPIGHIQVDGDYRESWQPHAMSKPALRKARDIARKVVNELCGAKGRGLFGVEMFVKGDKVWFSELSPRPHDTGMVTMVTQNMSEMELHVRAILGLPIPEITCQPGASVPVLGHGNLEDPTYTGIAKALAAPGTSVRIFGKPEVKGHRRMAVALATGRTVKDARRKAMASAKQIKVG